MPISDALLTFNGGELSPLLDARVDIEKYRSGARFLENFITTTYGAIQRRPGTEYLGAAKFANKACRLIGFNYSTTTRFVLEVGEGYIRVWSNGAPVSAAATVWVTATDYAVDDYVTESGTKYRCLVAHTSGTFATDLADEKWEALDVVEVTTPYTEADLREIQYVQINDLVYFAHPLYPPQKLTRLADDDWNFAEVVPDWPALLDENTRPELQLDVSAPLGGEVVIFPTGGWSQYFSAESVGGYLQLSFARDTAFEKKTFAANGLTTGNFVLGGWTLTTYGTWGGDIQVQRSYDSGVTWTTIRTYHSDSDRNISVSGTELKPCLLRLSFINRTAGGATDYAILEPNDPRVYGLYRIVSVAGTAPVVATAEVIVDPGVGDEVISEWSEGAWSQKQGYPRAVELHEGRIFWGGTAAKALTVWGSAIDDFENFRVGANASDGLAISIAANEASVIQWLASKGGDLLVGTASIEGSLGSASADAAISPDDIQWTRHTAYGSKYMQPLDVGDVLLFVQRKGRRLRELFYNDGIKNYTANDTAILAEHVTRGEIVEIAHQRNKDSVVWAIRGDGTLLGLTYEREQNVFAWHRHTTQGSFESVAVIHGDAQDDEVWFSVRRRIGSPGLEQTVRYVERFRPDWREAYEEEDKANWWYLDCAKRVDSLTPTNEFSEVEHLRGKSAGVLLDGADAGSATVTSLGGITLEDEGLIALVGLPYVSTFQPMKLELALRNGPSMGRRAKIDRMKFRLLQSLGGQYSTDGTEYNDIPTRSTEDDMDASPPVFTGDTEYLVDEGNFRDSADVWVRQDKPMPLTLLAIIANWSPSQD